MGFGQQCHIITKTENVILGCIVKSKTCKICEIIPSSIPFTGKDLAQIYYSLLSAVVQGIDWWDLLSLKK